VTDARGKITRFTYNGQKVTVFVAKESPYAGKVINAIIPDAAQLAEMRIP